MVSACGDGIFLVLPRRVDRELRIFSKFNATAPSFVCTVSTNRDTL